MNLYFLRHGDAEPTSAGTSNEARRLTERGKRETAAVAQAARSAGLRPEVILTSPLRRARETGEVLQEVFGVVAHADERLGSGCHLGAIQDLVAARAQDHILLVGHEPDFSSIVGQLIGPARVRMRTSGLAYVQTERVEPGQGTLVWLLTPALFGVDG